MSELLPTVANERELQLGEIIRKKEEYENEARRLRDRLVEVQRMIDALETLATRADEAMQAMSELLPITLEDMIKEIDVELKFRAQVFPKQMQGAGLARRNYLERRVEIMREIKRHLEAERDRA